MTAGPTALHGGGEFLPGDERFLAAIIEAAPRTDGVVQAVVVPTAAARGRPDLAAANGVEALRHVAAAAGIELDAAPLRVVDVESADDPQLAARLGTADLIHLPGGDPDLIPTLLPGTAAWSAITSARARGAVLAGASAGAMALGGWTWTPRGGIAGLGLVPEIIVVPHADARSWTANLQRFGDGAPAGLGVLGLGERTGVLIPDDGSPWRVVGAAEVRWLPPAERTADAARVFVDGDTFDPRGG
jgi:cyanophycinase